MISQSGNFFVKWYFLFCLEIIVICICCRFYQHKLGDHIPRKMSLENKTEVQAGNSSVYLTKMSNIELGIMVALYVLLLVAIITGNGLVLSAFSINKRLRTATNTLIMGLAVSDILVGFVSIPCWLYIFTLSHKQSPVNPTTYQLYITFDIFIGAASILQLTALTFKKDLKLSVTLAFITGLFVVAWLPLFVVTMIGTYYKQYLPPTRGTDRVLQFVKFCHYSNSALNPIVYAFRNNEMISTFRYIAHLLLCKVQQEPFSRTSSFKTISRRYSLQSSLKRSSTKSGSGRENKKEEIKRNSNRAKTSETMVFLYTTV
ncbi:histamine H2 receptor-like [Orbicella faveolata]|uniref:histamine H2 receptor-like n=1 Tax=Orbicella faveolata TaxID=48498 RepID=UPI0009E54424|nr:histamine H2 receptor-like [Orbicella faveolata]